MQGKILFISHFNFLDNDFTGGQKLAKAHFNIVKSVFGENNTDIIMMGNGNEDEHLYFMGSNGSRAKSFISSVFGYIRGYSKKSENKILERVKQGDYEYIFCDFSCYGTTLKKIRKIKKDIKIITFFHDVESNYEINRMKKENFLFVFSYFSARRQEKLTVKYSDRIIALNDRDAKIIKQKYKKTPDITLPIIVIDRFDESKKAATDGNLLFVGSLFSPNLDGIRWYKENVAPKINYTTLIVGKDFENLRDELETDNLKIIGTVDDVGEYYYKAKAMVMPIRYGDGMKVKTAEALMYGKNIIGTDEALEGYAVTEGETCYRANTPSEFIEAINSLTDESFNEKARELFIENYSVEAGENKIRALAESIK